jgi:hypothetical protein
MITEVPPSGRSTRHGPRGIKAFFRKALEAQGRPQVSIMLDGYAASHRAVRELPEQSLR